MKYSKIKSPIFDLREELKDEENAVKVDDNIYIANYTYEDEVNFYNKVLSLMVRIDDFDEELYRIANAKYNRALFSPSDWKPDQIQM